MGKVRGKKSHSASIEGVQKFGGGARGGIRAAAVRDADETSVRNIDVQPGGTPGVVYVHAVAGLSQRLPALGLTGGAQQRGDEADAVLVGDGGVPVGGAYLDGGYLLRVELHGASAGGSELLHGGSFVLARLL